jgi:predicted AAA+ superfamily ATPase
MASLPMANLAREFEVAHATIKSWPEQLRRLFLIFSIPPWTRKISSGLRKEKKWYSLDCLYAPECPGRLESMVANCLFRASSATMTDMGYGNYRLSYLRTIDKHEVDFIIEVNNSPMIVIEVKSTDRALSNSHRNPQRWFSNPTLGIQVVDRRGILERHPDQTWLISVERFLSLLV